MSTNRIRIPGYPLMTRQEAMVLKEWYFKECIRLYPGVGENGKLTDYFIFVNHEYSVLIHATRNKYVSTFATR